MSRGDPFFASPRSSDCLGTPELTDYHPPRTRVTSPSVCLKSPSCKDTRHWI